MFISKNTVTMIWDFIKNNFAKLSLGWVLALCVLNGIDAHASAEAVGHVAPTLNMTAGIMMSVIMLIVIGIIATEVIQRTLIVFFVAASLIFLTYVLGEHSPVLGGINSLLMFFWISLDSSIFNLLTLDQAFASVDGEVIMLLVGMMIIVGVLGQTKLFEWLAFKMFVFSKGNIKKLFFMFFLITAVLSAFLDNVTTIFLITPVAISICRLFDFNPVKMIIPLIIASNVWGAATLIWDPPNIMIGSYSWLSFNQFIVNLWPPVVVILIAVMFKLYYFARKDLSDVKEIKNFDKTVKKMAPDYKIKHKKLLKASLIVLAFVIIFFFLHGMFHMPAAVPAIMWAALLMFMRDRLIRKKFAWDDEMTEEAIHVTFSKDVEWLVIGFFIFLFMIVWALEHTGILDLAANMIQDNFGDNLLLCALVILWVSAIFSAFLDNIPFTAVMLPVVASLIAGQPSWVDATFLWWSLALWACLGGNGTIIWASANIVAAGLLQKEKYNLSFMAYLKVWLPSMFFQVFLASFAVYFMYLGSL